MNYPYQTQFLTFLKNQQLSRLTVTAYDQSITDFFNYLAVNNEGFAANPSLDNIFDRDIESYFASLTTERHSQNTTKNKILSHINRYFKYLFTHQLTTHLPTIDIHGNKRNIDQQFATKWLTQLEDILADNHIHFYTRMTLFLISHGYQSSEFLQPNFYLVYDQLLPQNEFEKNFISTFNAYISPIQASQNSKDIFLKQRLNLKSPQLSSAALHKYLDRDANYLGFSISPAKLYQSYVLMTLAKQQQSTDTQLEETLRMDPQSLLYYKQLLLSMQTKKN
ncbi:site-specific integrase [Paucilactobacillus suebicus]|uniref:Core-binding (CB) domain-containing protein n=1 Tax=Paucilactobacillus suebicus DSM 5007 = KCTC 3549 TaxID=1423807 RepID=A0A0R1W1S2_9LACO|nr:site-specific integrase [Paucilactobacillus suebicus]KRM11538.1 hypothetical protein FD16_GL000656 [Paucilactobacillus suebicus DSM 5007 = KCTC 3549]